LRKRLAFFLEFDKNLSGGRFRQRKLVKFYEEANAANGFGNCRSPEVQVFSLKNKGRLHLRGCFESGTQFIQQNYKKVFERPHRTYYQMLPESPEFKKVQPCFEEYKKIHGEYFLFKKNGIPIGWFYGEMEDFETFYMRNTGILLQTEISLNLSRPRSEVFLNP
jgi:hypothetical protein